MALLDSEIQRIKFELGYNLLNIGAVPYVQHMFVFEQVIQPHLLGGAVTESSTPVTASVPAVPTPVTLTLADATGFHVFDNIYVDIDTQQESAVVRQVTGNTIVVYLSKSHIGTYPVTVEAGKDGGEAIVRELLKKLKELTGINGLYHTSISGAGIKRADDDVEFFPNGAYGGSKSRLQEIEDAIEKYRDDLASAVGFPNLRRLRNAPRTALELY